MNEPLALRQQAAQPTAAEVQTSPRPPSRGNRRSRRPATLAVVLVLCAVGAAAAWWLTRSTAAPVYKTALADHGEVSRTVSATGTVNPVLTVTVGSYVSGVINEVLCDFNTVVKHGQVCARIDPRPFQTVLDQDKANLDVAKAQLQKDQANLTYAKLSYDRNADLAKRGAVTQDLADSAKSALDQAQAQVALDQATIEQRQAELAAAQVNLDYTEIKSPVDGIVVSRNITIGQTVASSFQTPTLFLIAQDLAQMEVDTNASESDIGGVKEGAPALFSVDAYPSRNFRGEVTQVRVAPQTVQNVVTYDVVVRVANRDLALRPGMTASVRIVVDERKDALRVPSQALRYRPSGGGGPAGPTQASGQAGAAETGISGRIWLVRNGRPEAVTVATGLDDGTFTEILAGAVKPGDSVVVAEQQASRSSVGSQPRFGL
jgi:HlyD family secretion protein